MKKCGVKFDIIAISENWLKENDINDYNISNYQVTHLVRKNKGGGGVSIYVINSLLVKSCCYLSTVVDGVMECVTVEIISKAKNNVIVSCIYRTPGSCITNFIEIISYLLQKIKIKERRLYFVGIIILT